MDGLNKNGWGVGKCNDYFSFRDCKVSIDNIN